MGEKKNNFISLQVKLLVLATAKSFLPKVY